jgi:hypothetical protein
MFAANIDQIKVQRSSLALFFCRRGRYNLAASKRGDENGDIGNLVSLYAVLFFPRPTSTTTEAHDIFGISFGRHRPLGLFWLILAAMKPGCARKPKSCKNNQALNMIV